MSLPKEKTTLAIILSKCGANPALIAQYLDADHRSILKELAKYDIFGPWPKIPPGPLSSALRTQARAILQNPTLLLSAETVKLLKEGDAHLNPDKCNLLLRAIIDEQEQLALTTT